MNFQRIVEKLNNYWSRVGLLIGQPYGIEVGAGTGNPNTFFRVLGPEPFNVAYVEPSRRPADGRYGENPNRLQHYFQYQIILKPAPSFHLDLYFGMLEYLGINPFLHDIRLVEDNWASPSLRAWGLGWEVWLDSMEVTQYTYFQQMGGYNLSQPTVEITLGLERLAMYIQNVDNYTELKWNEVINYGDLFKQHEYYQSLYNFEQANVKTLFKLIDLYFSEVDHLIKLKNFWVAYDYILKISHIFNVLDARGVTSAEYRRELFNKIGDMLNKIATLYVNSRKALGFPLKNKTWKINKILNKSNVIDNKAVSVNKFDNFLDIDLKKSFLLEIDFEDLPFKVLQELKERITKIIENEIEAFNISISKKKIILTPRRVGFVLENPKLKNSVRIIKGPPKKVVIDDYGNYTELYSKVLEKYENVMKTKIKDGFLYIHVRESIDWNKLINDFINKLFSQLPFKYMNYKGKRLIRPIRSVIAFLNGEILDLSNLKISSFNEDFDKNKLLLPIFSGGGKTEINDISVYLSVLNRSNIILDPDIRLNYIKEKIREKIGVQFNFNVGTEKKLKAVSMFVESPSIYFLDLPKKYNKLPNFLVNYILWENQRFIDIKKGTFVVVANNPFNKSAQNIKRGALKVSTARLEDGLFYFMRDKDLNLHDIVKVARNINIGGRKLETVKDKVKEIFKNLHNVLQIANKSLMDKFLFLWHVDLATNLGREFPTLSGKIMSHYLNKSWLSIKEHSFVSNKKLLSFLFDLSFDIESYSFSTIEARIKSWANDSQNRTLIKDVLVFYISVFIDDMLYTIKKFGLPKGASDKYGLKAKVDGLFSVLWILYREFLVYVDVQNVIELFFSTYDIKKVSWYDLISFMKKRLLNFVYKIISQQDIKVNSLYTNKKFISAITITSGIKLPMLCFLYQQQKNNIQDGEQYEYIYTILKRIYNLIKNDANNFFDKYRFEDSNRVISYLTSLYENLHRLSTEEKSNLTSADLELKKALKENLRVCNDKLQIQHCITCDNFVKLYALLERVSKYIDSVKIHGNGNNNINTYRRILLLMFLAYSFLFINIRAWLGQGFE